MLKKIKDLFNGKNTEPVNTAPVNTEPVVDVVANTVPTKKVTNKKTSTKKKTKKTKKSKSTPNNAYAEKMLAKELATKNGEAWVDVIEMTVDPNDVNRGSFRLDWNDKFVLNLIKQGYKLKESDTDQEIVDRWYSTVCRNVALELYEQEMADPEKRRDDIRVIRHRDLGNGRTEVS